jgi:hypothetical protein
MELNVLKHKLLLFTYNRNNLAEHLVKAFPKENKVFFYHVYCVILSKINQIWGFILFRFIEIPHLCRLQALKTINKN